MTAPIPAITASSYPFAALLISAIERLVRSWKVNVGIPIFKIFTKICFVGQKLLMLKVKAHEKDPTFTVRPVLFQAK